MKRRRPQTTWFRMGGEVRKGKRPGELIGVTARGYSAHTNTQRGAERNPFNDTKRNSIVRLTDTTPSATKRVLLRGPNVKERITRETGVSSIRGGNINWR